MEKSSKLWAVVKFPKENDAVGCLPTSWFHGINKCYWPPGSWSDSAVNSAIRSCKPPDPETWKTVSFAHLKNNMFDDFESAKKKLKKASLTSDLESQPEISEDTPRGKKRKITKTTLTKFASFEISEDDLSNAEDKCTLSDPPKSNRFIKKKPETVVSSSVRALLDETELHNSHQFYDEEIGEIENGKTVNPRAPTRVSQALTPKHHPPDHQTTTGFIKKKPETVVSSSVRALLDETELHNSHQFFDEEIREIENDKTVNPRALTRVSQALTPTHNPPDHQTTTDYLKRIIRKQNVLQSALADLAEDVSEIKNKIDLKNVNSLEESDSIYTTVNLPVNSAADLKILEEYLSTDAAMSIAVKEIAASGGKNVYDLVYRATKKLITNTFASTFSYFGRRNKTAFCSLKLNLLLKKCSLKMFPNSDEKEAEIAIAKWLRRCTERAKKE